MIQQMTDIINQYPRTIEMYISNYSSIDILKDLIDKVTGLGAIDLQTRTKWNSKEEYYELYFYTHNEKVSEPEFLSFVLNVLCDICIGNL